MSDKTASRKTRVFISYSRKNKLFARKLNKAFDDSNIEAWVDWEGIPLSADWMAEITAAIKACDAFVFIISPDSLKSKVCMDELELGIQYNKKIVPVLYVDPEKRQKMHPKLASTNWVYMRTKKDDFKGTVPKLVESVQTDLSWVHQHTRLLQRASEWEQKSRNRSYLLQGSDLSEGESWMIESTKDETRSVVPLQAEYINTSRKDAVKRQRNLTFGVGVALAFSIILGFYAFRQSIEAQQSRDRAEISQRNAEEKEMARATQQAVAEEQKIIADANAQVAKAQRSAAEAKIYQEKVGELYASTLLAVDAYQNLPELDDAENILRHNIHLLPTPISQNTVNARIWTIQPSPDYLKFVTVDSAGKACAWSMEDGSLFFCIQHEGIVYDSAFSKDGSILVTGTEKGLVSFWDANTGEAIKALKFDGVIWDLNMHPDGEFLGIARSGAVSIINMKTLNEEFFFTQNGEVKVIDYDETGQYMGIGTSTGTASIWKFMAGQTIPGPKHNSEVIDVAFSPDGKWMVSVGADSVARGVLITSGGQKYSILHGDWVEDVTFSNDGSWFVTVSDDNTVRVIETATGQERLRMTHANFVQKVRVSSDDQWIATTGYDKTVRIWDSVTGAEVMQIPIDGVGSSIRFNKTATRLVVGDYDGNISIWDISKLKAHKAFVQIPQFSHKAIFSPDGQWLVVNSDDQSIWAIPADKAGEKEDGRKKIASVNGLTYDMVISSDSKWVAAVEYDSNIAEHNRVVLVSIDGQQKHSLSHGGQTIETVAFTPDNKKIITSDQNGLINIWDVNTRGLLSSFNVDGIALSLTISPDGKYLVAGIEEGNRSIVWSLSTLNQVAVLSQVGREGAAQFSTDGKFIATGSSEGTIYLWNAEDGSFDLIENKLLTSGAVLSMDFSPNNRYLSVGDATGYVYLFDLELKQEVARLAHVDKVSGVSFSPDGQQLAAVSRKTVSIWDVPSIPLLTRDTLVETACSHLIRNFDEVRWNTLFFEEEYRLICPNLPAGEN
ncbi:MAG: TIR domain-containing protein [Anaerolineales bacterium]|uniref:TIR domain-containing protein n=1 Tax=Candidatus Villigracilis proximus TaxID=3140683 RepID=UPI00313707EA|nr:TIR domain-containing protein [Anaerolineales bacterium]